MGCLQSSRCCAPCNGYAPQTLVGRRLSDVVGWREGRGPRQVWCAGNTFGRVRLQRQRRNGQRAPYPFATSHRATDASLEAKELVYKDHIHRVMSSMQIMEYVLWRLLRVLMLHGGRAVA